MGQGGSGLGYAGIHDGLVVEFDMVQSPEEHDTTPLHISVRAALGGILSADEDSNQTLGRVDVNLPNYAGHTQADGGLVPRNFGTRSVLSDIHGWF